MDFLAPLCVEFWALYVDLEPLCVESHPRYVDLWSLYVNLTPHITKPPLAKHRFLVITITKTKRLFLGAFVGALFTRNTNKINDKQSISRGYDSESGTTI